MGMEEGRGSTERPATGLVEEKEGKEEEEAGRQEEEEERQDAEDEKGEKERSREEEEEEEESLLLLRRHRHSHDKNDGILADSCSAEEGKDSGIYLKKKTKKKKTVDKCPVSHLPTVCPVSHLPTVCPVSHLPTICPVSHLPMQSVRSPAHANSDDCICSYFRTHRR
jgi:hypothetical protein